MKRMKTVAAVVWPLAVGGCATASECAPTGWVDRIEEGYAVVALDGDEEDGVPFPLACFPEPPREGTRVVAGRIDAAETEKVRAEIQALVESMESSGALR